MVSMQWYLYITLVLVPAVVKRMLKTRVALGNIYRNLLTLIIGLIFVMFKDSPLQMFTQLTFIFPL